MDFNEYQELTNTTAIYPKDKSIEYLTMGLCSEAGEVADKVKKVLRDGGTLEEKADDIMAEAGDVLWYVAQIGVILGFSMQQIAENNIAKLSSRKERDAISGSGDER